MKYRMALALSFLLSSGTSFSVDTSIFEKEYQIGETTLALQGTGLVRYKKIFKVYTAALYTVTREHVANILGDVPKRLELAYLRPLTKDIFVDIGNKTLTELLTPSEKQAIQERLDKINAAYQNVNEGDRYSLTYIPGKGTELALNGKPQIVIEGADFAAAYFGIWLHPDGAVPDLRKTLLDPKG